MKSALSALNREGYPFQYAVARRTGELFDAESTRWTFEVAEFPVATGSSATRIDLVLSHADKPLLMTIECKKVHPSFAWCFSRTEYVRRDYDGREVIFDELIGTPSGVRARVSPHDAGTNSVFHVGLPFKRHWDDGRGAEGRQDRRHREDIEKALSQCFAGMNGLINAIASRPSLLPDRDGSILIPAVITNAELFTIDKPLETADLSSGSLSNTTGLKPVDWVWLRYHQSPHLLPSLPRPSSKAQALLGNTLSRFLDSAFARSAAVVSVAGIEGFLRATGSIERSAE